MKIFSKDSNYEILCLERIDNILTKLKIIIIIVSFLYSIYIYYIIKYYYNRFISYF
jgi:hypothetical protein